MAIIMNRISNHKINIFIVKRMNFKTIIQIINIYDFIFNIYLHIFLLISSSLNLY